MLAALAMVASVLTIVVAFPARAETNHDGRINLGGSDYLIADTFNNGSGDVDVIFHAAAADWSGNDLQVVLGHWGSSKDSQALRVQFTSAGHLQLVVRDTSGKGHVYSAWANDMKLQNGKGYWFRVRMNDSNAVGSTTKFFVSNDSISTSPSSVKWGTAVRSSSLDQAVALRNVNTKWTVGAAEGGSADRFKGAIGYVGLWTNGWSHTGGNRIINLNFRDVDQASNGYATWKETNHTWTVKGANWSYTEPTGDTPPPPPPPEDSSYMRLDGSTGTHLTTPSLSNGSSDMEFQFYVSLNDYTDGYQTVMSRWPNNGDQAKIRVQFAPSGLLQLLVKDQSGGPSYIYNGPDAASLGLANGEGSWFRIRLDSDANGSSKAHFWSSDALPSVKPTDVAWGAVDKSITKGSKVTPRNNFGKWEIGSYNGGNDGMLAGGVHYVAFWRSGYATTGVKVFELNLNDTGLALEGNWGTWVDSVGNVWEAKGSGWEFVTTDDPPPPPPPPSNEAPTAKTDHYYVDEGATVKITKSSLLSNDTDPEGDALTVKSVNSTTSMGVTLTKDGTSWIYKAAGNAGGAIDTITYVIEDTAGNTAQGQAKVHIEDANDPVGFDVIIKPGDNIASIVANKPAGTSFYVKAGKYRLQQIQPKDGMTFVGENGAVLSGAKKLTTFGQSGGLWYADGQTQGSGSRSQGAEYGWCGTSGNNACVFPEQLIINNQQLEQVDTKAEVGPGEFYFDYGANRIWFADSPTGKTVETSVTRYAFWGNADNVTIKNLVIEKYANPGPHGAINPRLGRIGSPADNWTIRDNTIRYNNGYAILLEDGLDIIGNHIHHNGHMGIAGNGRNILIQNNEVSYNCLHDYNCFPGLGAIKLVDVHNATIKGNYVHHNWTHGLHSDLGCTNLVWEGNIVTDNEGSGLSQEISAGAVIRNNVFERNGYRSDGKRNPGIIILNSADIEVYGNTVRDNADGIILRQDQRTGIMKLTNVWVHDNTVDMDGLARTGFQLTGGVTDTSYMTSRNNRFDYNDYTFDYSNQWHKPFYWIGGQASESTWKNAGMGAHSTYKYL